MAEKTTVTKPEVPESSDKTTVTKDTVPESVRKEIENSVRENLRAEYSRESKGLSDKLEEAQEKIAALEEKVNLTEGEKQRLEDLKKDEAFIERGLAEIDSRADLAPWREKLKREGAKVKSEAVNDAMYEMSLRQAKNHREKVARQEGVKVDDLIKELNPILEGGRWGDMLPMERLERALEERARLKDAEAVREENKRLKAERDGFSEDGQRLPRTKSAEELREAHIAGDMDAGVARARELDQRQKELEQPKK